MNTNNSSQASTAQCCVDYCEISFSGSGGPVVNTYACDQPTLTSAEVWQIHKSSKSAARVTSLPAVIVH